MNDILYVLGTLAFFALMLAYVAGCERLGGSDAPRGGRMTLETRSPRCSRSCVLVYLVYTLLRPERF